MTASNPARPKGFEIKGWHVLAFMLAFFGLIIAVNAVFITMAVRSFPGEDVRRSYVQGLAYNDTLEARRRQEALGWRASAGFAAEWLEVRILDREGFAVDGAQLVGTLRRPTETRSAVALTFTGRGDGRYVAAVEGLAPGAWDLVAGATRGADSFELNARLTWPPSTSH